MVWGQRNPPGRVAVTGVVLRLAVHVPVDRRPSAGALVGAPRPFRLWIASYSPPGGC